MKHFEYTARRGGRDVVDQLPAIDEATARAELESLGFEVISICEAPPRITAAATAADEHLPLDVVLAALADDLDDRRLRTAVRQLNTSLARGVSLDEALEELEKHSPRYLSGVLRAATSSGDLAQVCEGFTKLRESSERSWREVRSVLYYPLILILTLVAVGFLISYLVFPQFREIYAEFDVTLPVTTRSIMSVGPLLPWLLLNVLVLWMAVVLVPKVFNVGYEVRSALPLVGRIFSSISHEQFASTLATFVKMRMPLGTALTYTADLLDDRSLARATYRAAEAVEHGGPLSHSMAAARQFDRSLAVLVRWGEQRSNLAESLALAADLFADSRHQRSQLLRRVAPPLAFAMVATTALVIAAALLSPLMTLMEGLS